MVYLRSVDPYTSRPPDPASSTPPLYPAPHGVQPLRTYFDRNLYLSSYDSMTLRGNIISRGGGGSSVQMRKVALPSETCSSGTSRPLGCRTHSPTRLATRDRSPRTTWCCTTTAPASGRMGAGHRCWRCRRRSRRCRWKHRGGLPSRQQWRAEPWSVRKVVLLGCPACLEVDAWDHQGQRDLP